MEPSRSLNNQIFSRLEEITYRNLSIANNPLEIPNIPHVDFSKPMDILISQDCTGFNLGSFLIRRSEFTRRLLDMWWDPIFYEQKHIPRVLRLTIDIWNGIIKNKMHLYCLLRHPLTAGTYILKSTICQKRSGFPPSAKNQLISSRGMRWLRRT